LLSLNAEILDFVSSLNRLNTEVNDFMGIYGSVLEGKGERGEQRSLGRGSTDGSAFCGLSIVSRGTII
jgi:hypothetical protein